MAARARSARQVVLRPKPIALDLCCGLGGWTRGLMAAGFEVWGFDIDDSFRSEYPGDRFHCVDVRLARAYLADLGRLRRGRLVVASPPCEGFSRWQMPWTRDKNPPPPDLSIWDACEGIARELALPIVIENVRMAQKWKGRAAWHCGSYYLWGSVPALMPKLEHRKKEAISSSWKRQRAVVPFEMAHWIGRCFNGQV